MEPSNPNVEVFNRDAISNLGYLYTTNTKLSSRLATQRSTDVILELGQFEGRSIIDMGCGDAFYTNKFWDKGRPRSMTAIDAAAEAIKICETRKEGRPISFQVGDAHCLPFPDNSFDVALVQSILHHDNDPIDLIREAFRVAPEVLIHEPNGNNLGLKIIEKASRYHREHAEKSYLSAQIVRWVERAGGRAVRSRFAGFVPMFSPDWIAKSMKAVEPLIEALPGIRTLACAVFIIVGKRQG